MNIVEDLDKLKQLHEEGALTDDEFVAAKSRLIGGEPPGDRARDIDELRQQVSMTSQIAELDRLWDMERESYLVRGRYVPTPAGAISNGLIGLLGGLVFTVLAGAKGASPFFLLLAVLVLAVGIGSFISLWNKALQYRDAEAEYQRKRADLNAKRPKFRSDSTRFG